MNNTKIECGIYRSKEIQKIYCCGVNEISRLIELGTIPKPLPGGGRYTTRRWSKAVVDRHLGLSPRMELKQAVFDVLNERSGKGFKL